MRKKLLARVDINFGTHYRNEKRGRNGMALVNAVQSTCGTIAGYLEGRQKIRQLFFSPSDNVTLIVVHLHAHDLNKCYKIRVF